MIFGLWKSRRDEARIHAIYGEIVAQARQPVFYAELGVPDTLEGRFEMIVLHAFLYLHRLKNEPEEIKDVAQRVFDLMFADMDRNLRELGVGDLSVPKKIKKMAQAFYGRTAAYDAALAEGAAALAEAVRRNVFDNAADADDAATIAAYMKEAADALGGQPAADLATRGPVYPAVRLPQRSAT